MDVQETEEMMIWGFGGYGQKKFSFARLSRKAGGGKSARQEEGHDSRGAVMRQGTRLQYFKIVPLSTGHIYKQYNMRTK
jgi:hypothetical protein